MRRPIESYLKPQIKKNDKQNYHLMMGTSVLNINNKTKFLKHRFQTALERLSKKAKPRWTRLPNPTIF